MRTKLKFSDKGRSLLFGDEVAGREGRQESDGGSDEDVPGPCNRGFEFDVQHEGEAAGHPQHGGALTGALGEQAKEEDAKQRTIDDGGDAEAGFKDAFDITGEQADSKQDGSPEDGHAFGDFEVFRVASLFFVVGLDEVHDGGGGEGVESGAEIAHGGSEDGGDDQATDAVGEEIPDEFWVDAVWRVGRGEFCVGVINPEQDADDEEESELEDDDEPAREESEPGISFVFGRKEALHHQLFGAVAGSGEEAAAEEAGPEGIGLGEELRG